MGLCPWNLKSLGFDMGVKCPHRKVKTRRYSHKQFRRSKFEAKGDDAVYDQLQKPQSKIKPLPLDEDLPGMGQYYCLHCDQYFQNVAVRDNQETPEKIEETDSSATYSVRCRCSCRNGHA